MPLFDNQVLDRNFSSAARPSTHAGLLHRAGMLREPDRTLFKLMLSGNVSHRQIARMLQVPAGTVTRRIRRLANRLHDPIVVTLADAHCPLSEEYRQLGLEHFLQAQSVPKLADLHRMSQKQVRDILSFLRGWHKGLTLARGSSACNSIGETP